MWKKFFKSPLLWAVIGIALIVIGNIYNNKDKYPYMTFWSRLLIIAGAVIVGFAGASAIKWAPLSKINVAG